MPLSDYFPQMKGWKAVDTPDGMKPQIPDATTQVSPYLRAPLPLPLQYAPDTLKQYNRPGLSSFRVSPQSPSSFPAINAASAGVAQKAITVTPSGNGLPNSLSNAVFSANLANGNSQVGTVTMAPVFTLVFVQTTAISRIQLYATAAARDTSPEPTRPLSVPPTPGLDNGVIADFYLTGQPGIPLLFGCSPPIVGANEDTSPTGTVYWRITNLSGSTNTITVTINFLEMEQT
ncbi:Uncharacterised protein [uncultured archaeon]|nr:Uncharacterised protein [uncultured archaeon]